MKRKRNREDIMQRALRLGALGAIGLLSVACRAHSQNGDVSLVATGPSITDSVATSPRPPAVAREQYRVPPDVLRNPEERMMLMQQLRREIASKTHGVPEERYRAEVRPQVECELAAAGFTVADVERILADVDYARSFHGHAR
jgi:hypothetical protein